MGYNPNFSDRVGQLSHFNHICHIRYIDIYIRYTDCAVLLKTFQKGVEGGGGLVKPMLKKSCKLGRAFWHTIDINQHKIDIERLFKRTIV